jgi:hypothetical protein
VKYVYFVSIFTYLMGAAITVYISLLSYIFTGPPLCLPSNSTNNSRCSEPFDGRAIYKRVAFVQDIIKLRLLLQNLNYMSFVT